MAGNPLYLAHSSLLKEIAQEPSIAGFVIHHGQEGQHPENGENNRSADTRNNIPTAEFQSVVNEDQQGSVRVAHKAEINAEARATLHSDTSLPFDRPKSSRIAVKAVNHLGDEVMNVFRAS
jgi:hypothetical protein